MNTAARLGFPFLATLLTLPVLLGSCKTEWDRWDDAYLSGGYDKAETAALELTISQFQPGKTTVADVERLIGPLEDLGARQIAGDAPQETPHRLWRGRGRSWNFNFTPSGSLQSFGRSPHTFCLAMGDDDDGREFDRWFEDRLAFLPVAPEPASEFTPGRTSQEDVVRAWGACTGGNAILPDGYVVRWGSNQDLWSLQFDSDGCLASTPQHYVSR